MLASASTDSAWAGGCRLGRVCGAIKNETSQYILACTTAPRDIRRWHTPSDCPRKHGYRVKPHTASSDGRRVDLDAFYVPGDHVFDGRIRCSLRPWKNSKGAYQHGWHKFSTDCVVTITKVRSAVHPPPPPPPPAQRNYRQYPKVKFKTWRTATGYRTPDCSYSDPSCRVGSLWANMKDGNYFYCQLPSARRLTDSGYHNHWWLYTDLDSPAGASGWVSAVYVTVGAQDAPIPGLRTC
ncbi:MAG: hypothetical protein M3296_08075 [Actinomycetota bacterium]|nr:hypothetical protein [Actinomycetota bacterium]